MIDVIIIGAGASGLLAAKILAEAGMKVLVLEAMDRIGGRIIKLPTDQWGYAAEGGAEFIHGNLEVTFGLLKEAGLKKFEIRGDMWQVMNGTWSKEETFIENQEQLISQLKKRKVDVSLQEFLESEFSGEAFADMRRSLQSYVEGYYAAEPSRLSAKTFLEQWLSEDEEQFRPAKGYGPLLHYLEATIIKHNGLINLNTVVKNITWSKNKVEVSDRNGHTYSAAKLITTVSLGVWNSNEAHIAHINFSPKIENKTSAAAKMGFGPALKVLIRCRSAFWLKEKAQADIGFIFSDQPIGTWWTQNPNDTPTLTGWVAGPKANGFKHHNDDDIYKLAFTSLQNIFGKTQQELHDSIIKHQVFNWINEPFILGAYSYSTTETAASSKILAQPVDDTLFFAGEALYNGTEMGTVEAAFTSAMITAGQIRP